MAGNFGEPERDFQFRTQPVSKGDLKITVTATGNLEATNQVEVGSELSGIIKSMTADYNDEVQSGQALAYLDDAKYTAAVMKSRAEVASAQANHAEAVAARDGSTKTLARYRKTHKLTNGRLPSLETLEQAETDLQKSIAAVKAAAAAIEMAKASLKSNETDLEKTVIYAPIGGIVLSRDVEPGQTVAASLEAPVLYTLAENLRHMELQVDVDEADVGMVQEGQLATFAVDAYPHRCFEAKITQVRFGAETTDGVVTYKTVMSVENPDLLLRPGMTATAEIIVENIKNALLVPNTALRFKLARPSDEDKPKRGLLSSLMPGPPRPQQVSKNGAGPDFTQAGEGGGGRIWVLKENHPVPIPVKKIATDGVHTAVAAEGLERGTEIILNQVATQG
jgi:HlyD family secretion protein